MIVPNGRLGKGREEEEKGEDKGRGERATFTLKADYIKHNNYLLLCLTFRYPPLLSLP